MTPNANTAVAQAKTLRTALDSFEKQLKEYRQFLITTDHGEQADSGEMIAHATLALRHAEDARMRLGKVIQYADGGTSIYDKK